MSLTPATTDPNYGNEFLRRIKEPQSFGVGGLTDTQKAAAQKRVEELQKSVGKK